MRILNHEGHDEHEGERTDGDSESGETSGERRAGETRPHREGHGKTRGHLMDLAMRDAAASGAVSAAVDPEVKDFHEGFDVEARPTSEEPKSVPPRKA